MHIQETPQDCN